LPFGIGLSVASDTCKGKTSYIWISLDLKQAGPTLGVFCCCCCCKTFTVCKS